MLSNALAAAGPSFASAARQHRLPSRITLVTRRSLVIRAMHRFQELEKALKLHDTQRAVQILATAQASSVELVSAVDASGASALHAAAARGMAQVVQQLIDKGAAPNAQDQRWYQPLHAAGRQPHSAGCHGCHVTQCCRALAIYMLRALLAVINV